MSADADDETLTITFNSDMTSLTSHQRLFLLAFTTVIIASDQNNGRSILTYQTNLDKIKPLTSHSMMGVSGPNCDLVNFTEYVPSLPYLFSFISPTIVLIF